MKNKKISKVLAFFNNYLFKLKKPRKVSRQQFVESVYHLSFYGNILNHLNYTKGEFTSGFSEAQIQLIAFSIRWNIVIITQSIMDELNKFLFNYHPGDKDLKNRIIVFRKIITPAYQEIRKWKDMKKFRNNVLAHNGRDYYGDSVILSSKSDSYNVPLYHSDFLILFNLLRVIIDKAEEIFAEEKQEAEKIMIHLNQNEDTNFNKRDSSMAIATINQIISEINKKATRVNSKL